MIQKCVTWLIIAITCCLACKAQPISEYDESEASRLFVRLYSSYGFLTKGSFQVPSSQTQTISDTSTRRFSSNKKGLGSGLRVGAGIGFVMSRYINLGVDAEYLMGSDLTYRSQLTAQRPIPVMMENGTQIDVNQKLVSDSSTTLSSKILSVIPQITFKAISTETINVYTRVGVIIGIPLVLKAEQTGRSTKTRDFPNAKEIPTGSTYYWDTISTITYRYDCKPAIGYMASLGIQASLTDHIKLIFELTSNSLILRPKTYSQDLRNQEIHEKIGRMPDRYLYDQRRNIIEYRNSGTSRDNPSLPDPLSVSYEQSPQISMTVNSLNAGLGIIYRF